MDSNVKVLYERLHLQNIRDLAVQESIKLHF